ncbi:MAG: DUF7523 family protein [Promethearchaeota archaeon]
MVRQKANNEISVAEATRRVIKGKPSIIDCLRYEVINYAALAQLIKPEVIAVCKKENIKLDSIKMSLMRFTDELKREKIILEKKVAQVLINSVLEVKNDLFVITVKQEHVIKKIDQIMEHINNFRFFQLIQGTDVFTILADRNNKNRLISLFKPDEIINILDDQSAIILISPKDIINVQGVMAYLTYILAGEQINITQVMSCHTDTIFLVGKNDDLKAYSAIRDKIQFLREYFVK